MAARTLLLLAFAFLSSKDSLAGNASNLPGSDLAVEKAVSQSNAILVGRIVKMPSEVSENGKNIGPTYKGVKVQVSDVLKGRVGVQTSITLMINWQYKQAAPAVGAPYLFFLTTKWPWAPAAWIPDPFYTLKILPASVENIARAKKLIADDGQTKP
jgi:hypothetical protein